MRVTVPGRGSIVLGAAVLFTGGIGAQEPTEELLRLHHRSRVAHVLADAQMLTSAFSSGFLSISGGEVSSPSREASLSMFGAYLTSVRFLEWEDLAPPRVRVSPGGHWGEVVVRKRVRLIAADTTRPRKQDQATFAWVERWERTGSDWRLATIVSTDAASSDAHPSLADQVRAYEILQRAREAVGGVRAVAAIATLRFTAHGEGPGGHFETSVSSARDGRVRFAQRFPSTPPFAAGVSLRGPWQRSGAGPVVDSLGSALHGIVNGHEFHLLAIAPESRFTSPVARPQERVADRDVDVVRFRDSLGGDADFFYDSQTGMPVGLRLATHSGRGAPSVLSLFSDWRRVGSVQLPYGVTITHGDEVFRYRVTEASAAWLTDAAFGPNATGSARPPGGRPGSR